MRVAEAVVEAAAEPVEVARVVEVEAEEAVVAVVEEEAGLWRRR